MTAEEAVAVSRAMLAAVRAQLDDKVFRDVRSRLSRYLDELAELEAEEDAAALEETAAGLLAGERPEPVPPGTPLRDPIAQELEASGVLPEGVSGAGAISAVLCALTRRLSAGEAFDLVSALPPALRPLVRRCVQNRRERPDVFGAEGLLRRVAVYLQTSEEHAEQIALAVFTAVRRALPRRAIDDVTSQLPRDLAALWLGTLAGARK